MMFKFEVYDLEDALIARSALDGMIQSWVRQRAQTSKDSFDYATGLGRAETDVTGLQPDRAYDIQVTVTEAGAVSEEVEEVVQPTTGYSKEQIKAAAAHNAELAALVSKKGRKSLAETARIQELTGEVVAAKPGIELAGKSPAELAEILAPKSDEPVAQQPEVIAAIVIPTATGPVAVDPLEALERAEAAAAAGAASQVVEQVVEQPAAKSFEDMNREELFDALQNLAEQDGRGLFWFRNVLDLGGGPTKMTGEHMRDALTNPDKFNTTI